MALRKHGSPSKLKVVKNASFAIDPNVLAEMISKQWPDKKLTMDQIHSGLKSIGIVNYSSEDLSILLHRLQAIGFSVIK